MTRDELFHDPLLSRPPVFRDPVTRGNTVGATEEVTAVPERRTPAPRRSVDQRSLELLRVQDELKKMARASRHA